MRTLLYLLACALPALAASSDDSKHPHIPCTIRSPTSGAFFDLNPVRLELPKDGAKAAKDARNTSWPARGWDYGANFTLNFCSPVVEELHGVVGVDKSLWGNVGAYYEAGGEIFSIGHNNSEPVFRGRKLVLNYTNGSPCPSPTYSHEPVDLRSRKIIGDDDDDDDKDDRKKSTTTRKHSSKPTDAPHTRRKNTIISLLCNNDPLAPEMAVSFVGTPDECTYIFEARSPAACGGVEIAQQQLGPGGVFGVIALIAVLVYVVGGCVYQRTVMHQRGWKQLPNYSLWSSIFGFFQDIFVIATSSCTRMFPSRRGYSRVSPGLSGHGSTRRGRQDSDDENRLIDQLDEEWDD